MERILAGIVIAAGIYGCQPGNGSKEQELPDYVLSGGQFGTIFDGSSNAFQTPIEGLSDNQMAEHIAGDGIFDSRFVTAPAPVNGGLGPQFNNTGCDGCHLKEGRGRARLERGPQGSEMLVFASLEDTTQDSKDPPLPIPEIGIQILDQAIFGALPNASATLAWVDEPIQKFGDGSTYQLRRPTVSAKYPDGRDLPQNSRLSLRQPLPVFGLGLVEAIPSADIKAGSEKNEAIMGRVNLVPDFETGEFIVGRFGRKASLASIRDQTAKALALDIGLNNELFSKIQSFDDVPNEITLEEIETASFYLRTIGVPARRNWNDPQVVEGQSLFSEANCIGCHRPQWETGDHEIEALAHQRIFPYSDFLLHDMGEALADNRPEFGATGREWRTPTLWGIGMTETILQNPTYLHDGRARTLQEAILWHGGQATGAKNYFVEMSENQRESLLKFLGSL